MIDSTATALLGLWTALSLHSEATGLSTRRQPGLHARAVVVQVVLRLLADVDQVDLAFSRGASSQRGGGGEALGKALLQS